MEVRLKAILEMKSSQMQKELIAASNNLKKFERELASATDTNHITYLLRNIGILNADINRLTASANASAKAMSAVGAATKTAGMNSMNFARVIQDLPFGFMGIQNNLTQLIPGIGAAGLAFSALTAAITFSQVGLSYWSKGTKAATDSAEGLDKVIKDMADSYAKERGQLDALYRTATNDNQSRQLRLNAVKGLRDNYGAYLKNFSDEEILAGKAATAYTNLANAIMMKARANAAQSQIDKIVSSNLANELKMIDVMTEANKKAAAVKDDNLKGGVTGGTGGVGTGQVFMTSKEDIKKGIFAQAAREVAVYAKEIEDGTKALKFLQDQVQSNQIAPFTEDKPTGGTTKTPKGKKPFDNARFASKMQAWQNESLAPAPAVKDNTKDTSQKPVKNSLNDPVYWAKLAEAKALNNQQILDLAAFSEYAGQAVGQMVNAMMNGENIGDVLANAFKQIAVQIAAAVAQALIFAALLEAFPALKGIFATVGAVVGNGGGGAGSILGNIKGQDIKLSNARVSTAMALRMGRTY